MPEQITISAEAENKVELFYDEIPVEREEEDVQILNAVPRNYYRSRLADDNTTPGKVFPTKTAEWVDEVNGLAKINFTIYGNPVRQGSDVILIVDSSGSMSGTKWSTAKSGAKGFVDNLYESVDGVPSDNRIAIVDFDSSAIAYPGINNSTETFLKADETIKVGKKKPVTYSATDYFKTYVIDNQMSASGGTNYDYAFQAAKKIIDGRTDTSRPVYIVFMSDGEPRDYDWSDYHTGQKDAADLRDRALLFIQSV